MRYASIRKMDISNGEGIGVALFVQGCNRHCFNCFNPETWDYNGGKEWSCETHNNFMKLVMKPFTQRVSILGGEPLAVENRTAVTELLADVKNVHRGSIKTWLWTGYKFEDIRDLETMQYLDYLIDGEYIDNLRDITLKWRGSSNQRLIDVQNSLTMDSIVLYDIER